MVFLFFPIPADFCGAGASAEFRPRRAEQNGFIGGSTNKTSSNRTWYNDSTIDCLMEGH